MSKLCFHGSEKQEQNKQLCMQLNTLWLIKKQGSCFGSFSSPIFMRELSQGLMIVQ